MKLKGKITLEQISKFKLSLARLNNLVHFVFDAEEGKLTEASITEFI